MKRMRTMAGIIAGIIAGTLLGGAATAYVYCKKYNKEKKVLDRNKLYVDLVSYWLANKNKGKSMSKFLIENNLKNIAIYGMGTMGELFYEEVENSEITVKCFVDKSAGEFSVGADNISAVSVKDFVSHYDVDALIITPMFYYDAIVANVIKEGCKAKLISLEEMIYDMK